VTARAHTTAVKALIDAAVTCHVGESPNDAGPPYVLLYPDSGHGMATGMDLDADHYRYEFQTTAVGTTVEQAQWAADKVRGAVEDVRPTVAGFTTGKVRHVSSQPAKRDNDVDPAVFYAVDVWEFRSF